MIVKQKQPHTGKLCVSVITIRNYNKLKLAWIEIYLISLTTVKNFFNIITKGSVNVVSGVNYLLCD